MGISSLSLFFFFLAIQVRFFSSFVDSRFPTLIFRSHFLKLDLWVWVFFFFHLFFWTSGSGKRDGADVAGPVARRSFDVDRPHPYFGRTPVIPRKILFPFAFYG